MNTNEQMQKLLAVAENGDALAQCQLAALYDNGKDVAKNDVEAAKWYGKSATQGNARAQFCLGWFYANGRGVSKDPASAVKWYRLAAEQGDQLAAYYLAEMYELGQGTNRSSTEAARWYRTAAERGNEKAKEKLAQMGAVVTEQPKPQKDAQRERPVKSMGADLKQIAREDTAREAHECRALLETSTPLVYVHNAFRITGLTVDATTRDIKRRIDDLKHAEELGDAEEEHKHAFALDPPPTIENIREAAQSLQDPERRIVEEFFWFWPSEWGKGQTDPALTALKAGDKDAAFKVWSGTLSNGQDGTSIVAKHNLAVMYQLVALDSEHYALESDLTPDQLQTVAKYWRTCFKWWEDLTTDETFWSLVTDRIRMHNDPRLTTGFARRMRTTLPEALDKINAMLAIAFFEKGKHDLGRNHVTYMLETHQGQDDVAKTLAIVTKPLKTRVVDAVAKAGTVAEREPKKAAQSARDLLNAVAEPLKIIRMILPTADHERIDLCDSVAEACLTCQIAYARETKDWSASIQILDAAKGYATSQETRNRIEENRSTVANNQLFAQYLDPIAKAISKVGTRTTTAEKLKAVEADVLPLLRAIEGKPNITAEVYTACADLVARHVRELSVNAWNEDKDIALAIRALDIAAATVRGDQAREQLSKDRVQLVEIRKNEEERRLFETCWFCKHNKATETGKLDTKMYGDVTRTPTLSGTNIQWRNITVPVPRCDRCKEAHSKVGGKWAGAAAGAAAGTAVLPVVGTIIGALVGGAIGKQVDGKLRLPPGVASETTKRDFPPLKQLIAQGWTIGDRPT